MSFFVVLLLILFCRLLLLVVLLLLLLLLLLLPGPPPKKGNDCRGERSPRHRVLFKTRRAPGESEPPKSPNKTLLLLKGA